MAFFDSLREALIKGLDIFRAPSVVQEPQPQSQTQCQCQNISRSDPPPIQLSEGGLKINDPVHNPVHWINDPVFWPDRAPIQLSKGGLKINDPVHNPVHWINDPVLRPAPVAIQKSGWGFHWIGDRDLNPVGLTWVANQWVPLAQMKTPQNSQLRIMKGEKRLRSYFYGQSTTTGQNLSSATATTVNLPFLVQTPRPAPSLPSTYFPDVSVWTQVNGVWQQLTITGVTYPNGVTVGTGTVSVAASGAVPNNSSSAPTGSVTFTEPAGITGTIYIYYTHSDGEMRFRVARDTGGVDDSSATVFNQSFATLNLIDQNNQETAIAWPQQVDLVPDTRLVLEVYTTTVPMVWNSQAGNHFYVGAMARRLEVLNKGGLLTLAEIQNRNGL